MSLFSSLFGCNKPSKTTETSVEFSSYQFTEPKDTSCFTCRHVVKEGAAIVFVSHDADDGEWQFLCGDEHTEADAMIVGIAEIVTIDPSVNELYEMPEGVGAIRETRDGEWKFFKSQ